MAKITRSNLQQIRVDIDAALKAVATKHGIDFTLGRIVFNENEFRGKLTAVARGAAGANPSVTVSPEMLALAKYKSLLGPKFKMDAEYKHPRLGTFKVVGYNSRAREYPVIIAQVGTGKKYKLSLEVTKSYIA